MGLAVLPAQTEGRDGAAERIYSGRQRHSHPMRTLEKHADWVAEFLPSYQEINAENIDGILEQKK